MEIWFTSALLALVKAALMAAALVCAAPHAVAWCRFLRFLSYGDMAVAADAITRNKETVDMQMAVLGRVVFTHSADAARQVFKSSAFVNRLGSDWGLRQLGMLNQGIIWNNGPGWQTQRKWFVDAVQTMHGKGANVCATACVQAFQATARHFAGSTAEVHQIPDATDFMRACTFRVICALAFGIPMASLPDQLTMRAIHTVTCYFKAWSFYLLCARWLDILLQPLHWRQARQHRQAVMDMRALVAELMELGAQTAAPGTFLQTVLGAVQAGVISDSDAQQCCLEMLLAGTDTSSVTMGYLLLALRDDPLLEAVLRQEVLLALETTSGKQVCGNDLGRCLGAATLREQEAAVFESMRFKPVGPVSIRQAAPGCGTVTLQDGDAVLRLAPGDSVVVNLAGMHRDPGVFPNPSKFDVANFLSSASVARLGHNFFPFGHGRKGCLGNQLAMLEMKVLVSLFLMAFTFVPGGSTASLASLETRWDVANQPTGASPIALRLVPSARMALCSSGCVAPHHPRLSRAFSGTLQRVYLVGPGGTGKTTLLNALLQTEWGSRCSVIRETARQVMMLKGIRRADLASPSTFCRLQHLIAEEHCAQEAELELQGSLVISDRSGIIDTLAHMIWKFGGCSQQVRELLDRDAAQELLARALAPSTLILLVPPFQPGEPCEDDGTRLLDVCGLAAAFDAVLKHFPQHRVIAARTVDSRVAEVKSMLAATA